MRDFKMFQSCLSLLLRSSLVVAAVAILTAISAATKLQADEPEPRWWKGNLHTHSLWSDGDEFPEMIAAWYREQGYNFLALSDHNVLSQGMKWMTFDKIVARADDGILDRYRAKFGNSWVETRGEPTSKEFAVRLKPLDEFRYLIEERNQFILIPAEEITDKAEGKPVHRNATNLLEAIAPLGGATVREAMQNNLRAVLEHERKSGREILPHLNHPNFGYAITAEDLAAVVSERFFEVFNGHPGVNQLGDAEHPSLETMWDISSTLRLISFNAAPLMGVGTDDSHEYHGKPGSRPGRGWVMVRSRYLTPEHLIRAMKAGDFYASSGVTLKSITTDTATRTLSVEVDPVAGATYTIEFVVSQSSPDAKPGQMPDIQQIGKVAKTVTGTSGSYTLSANDLYVRARITSSQDPVDPAYKDQKQQAWTQPFGYQVKEEK